MYTCWGQIVENRITHQRLVDCPQVGTAWG
jgi:hypothetical protein